jgi:hypothetical protein
VHNMSSNKLPEKWKSEEKAIKAIQLAFDLDEKVQYTLRREALECDINPSERIRQILGLESNKIPQRPRLSISLRPQDFSYLAKKYDINKDNKKDIKHRATLELQEYVKHKDITDNNE